MVSRSRKRPTTNLINDARTTHFAERVAPYQRTRFICTCSFDDQKICKIQKPKMFGRLHQVWIERLWRVAQDRFFQVTTKDLLRFAFRISEWLEKPYRTQMGACLLFFILRINDLHCSRQMVSHLHQHQLHPSRICSTPFGNKIWCYIFSRKKKIAFQRRRWVRSWQTPQKTRFWTQSKSIQNSKTTVRKKPFSIFFKTDLTEMAHNRSLDELSERNVKNWTQLSTFMDTFTRRVPASSQVFALWRLLRAKNVKVQNG